MNNTIDTLIASIDTYISNGFPTTNFGTSTTLVIATADFALIEFDLSSIPVGSTINEAIFSLATSGSGSGSTIEFFRLVRDWVELEATWFLAKTGTNWGTAGANNTSTDFDNTSLGTISISSGDGDGVTKTLDVLQTVSDWHDGTNPNHGFKIELSGGSTRIYRSSETADNLKPRLLVTYTYPALDFQLNSNNIDSGIQAHWAPIPTGKKAG